MRKVKINRCFINALCSSTVELSVVNAIINMVNCLDIRVVAKGVESAEQCSVLHRLRCDVLQGYFFQPPWPVEACEPPPGNTPSEDMTETPFIGT